MLEHGLTTWRAGLADARMGVLLFMPGWFGGGDAKLMAAIGLWIGVDNLLAYMLYVALAGGVIAAAFFSARSVPLPRMLLGEAWALRLHRHDTGIPYGLALAAGALAGLSADSLVLHPRPLSASARRHSRTLDPALHYRAPRTGLRPQLTTH